MVEVFKRAIKGDASTAAEIEIMREAYFTASATLKLRDNAERRRLVKIVHKISKLEQLPTSPILARRAVDWYVAALADD